MRGVEATSGRVARLPLGDRATLARTQRHVEADDQPTPRGLAVVQVWAGRDRRVDARRDAHPDLGLGVDDRNAQNTLTERRAGLGPCPTFGRTQSQALGTAIVHDASVTRTARVGGRAGVEGVARRCGRGQANRLAVRVEGADLGGVAALPLYRDTGLGP